MGTIWIFAIGVTGFLLVTFLLAWRIGNGIKVLNEGAEFPSSGDSSGR